MGRKWILALAVVRGHGLKWVGRHAIWQGLPDKFQKNNGNVQIFKICGDFRDYTYGKAERYFYGLFATSLKTPYPSVVVLK